MPAHTVESPVTFNQGIFNNVEKHLGLSQLRGCCWHLLFRCSLWVWGCTHSSNTWVEAGEMNQWGHFWLHSELNISLSYTRLPHTSLHRGQRFPFTPNRHHHHPCHGHHYKELSSSVHCAEAKKHRCEALSVSLHPAAVIAIHNLLNVDLWLILDLGFFFNFLKRTAFLTLPHFFCGPWSREGSGCHLVLSVPCRNNVPRAEISLLESGWKRQALRNSWLPFSNKSYWLW